MVARVAGGRRIAQLRFPFRVTSPEPVATEIMSKPVVTVGEDTDAAEIARLLTTYRIKRVPVVRDGRVVGIVSRENLLRWMANEAHPRRQA